MSTLDPELYFGLGTSSAMAVGAAGMKQQLALDALDRLTMAIVLADEKCGVILANSSARSLLGEADGLKVCGNELVASSRRENNALHTVTAQVVLSHSRAELGALTISRTSLRRPFELVVVPVAAKDGNENETRRAAAIFIGDDRVRDPLGQTLASLYGLTLAETRLAVMLMRGKSLDEASCELRIAKETARKQLRSVFGKTSTNRQSELVRLLVGGPANIRVS
jgi:DNA-binding CsgD family transcriptional regulator